jgi:hypothetical protein
MYKVEIRQDKGDKIRVRTFKIEAENSVDAIALVSREVFPNGVPATVDMSARHIVE